MTKVKLRTGGALEEKLDALAVLLHEKDEVAAPVDAATGGAAGRAVALGDFKGKLRQTALLYGAEDARTRRVLLTGLGPRKEASLERVRAAAGAAAQLARKLELKRLGIAAGELPAGIDPTAFAVAAAEGSALAAYSYERYRTRAPGEDEGQSESKHEGKADKGKSKSRPRPRPGREPKKGPPDLTLTLFADGADAAAVERAAKVAAATNLARDLANEPGNKGTPTALAEAAERAGREHGFKVKVLGPADMERLGMGGLLGVARGSDEEPRFIQMEYTPKGAARGGTVCLVGKGLTFDSGGISIKPADKMWEMKWDKCGGCAVIGAMAAVASCELPIRVVGLVPATENMPGARANKPGDVLTALNGKTIEVLNTDAEGRIILADALAYAERFDPEVVIDFATLTGSVVVALGDIRAGLLSPHAELRQALERAADATGELVWPLPMDDAYGEHVKGEYGDVKNLGKGRDAGTIAGAWFLKHFVPEGAAWAHVDIAGTAWVSGESPRPYLGKGATGFGVRLAFEYLRARCEG